MDLKQFEAILRSKFGEEAIQHLREEYNIMLEESKLQETSKEEVLSELKKKARKIAVTETDRKSNSTKYGRSEKQIHKDRKRKKGRW